ALRVFILGMGLLFWAMFLPVVCHALCLWFTFKHGEAPWDVLPGTKVRVEGPLLFPVLLFVVLFAAILVLLGIVMVPALQEAGPMLRESPAAG
ncbi:MAG: hypothetical protein GWO24_27800, partial [Akkermansiaceae bacterium]|nr:hypothetical protein [Akkermansiaceae bacterium]